jgi:hypothetical protein
MDNVRIVIVILLYHCHKPIDLIKALVLIWKSNIYNIKEDNNSANFLKS